LILALISADRLWDNTHYILMGILMAERIQKMLSRAGYGSRREIERWIGEGLILVNGSPATIGQAIEETDQVILRGQRLRLSSRLHYALAPDFKLNLRSLSIIKKWVRSVLAMILRSAQPFLRIYQNPTAADGFKSAD